MGIYVENDNNFWLSTRYQLWHFVNMLEKGQMRNNYDRLYVPRQSFTTGDLDIHDLAIEANGRLVFIATGLNSLATNSSTHSCRPLWKPPFISQYIGEDRCHLNGLALRDGYARYVTAIGGEDAIDSWREHRIDGGMAIDIKTNETVVTGLSMPHSPRWYGDRLWLLNSGQGEFGYVDLERGTFESVCFCPGYARGLAFIDKYAIVGLSKPRDRSFDDLPLGNKLITKGVEPRCGLLAIDLDTGAIAHWFRFDEISELYDVQVIPKVRRPQALGIKTDEIARFICLPKNLEAIA